MKRATMYFDFIFLLQRTELPNGLRYRRLERTNSRNGKLPTFRTSSKKRAESQPSGARFVGWRCL
jgi:hypothetical protein